jgi:hypothetical protein
VSRARAALALAALAALVGCADPAADAGEGDEKLTTWGEAFIEEGLPADPTGEAGFVDGWSLRYTKFLVAYRAFTVADEAGHVVASLDAPRLVDNVKPGRKLLATFAGLEAKAYERVAYEIAPATSASVLVGATPADLALMVEHGYALYVEGSADKPADGGPAVHKSFRWGFASATRYFDCHAEEDGKDTLGVVVTRGGVDTTELTTHGDHLFYDRLQSSPDPAIRTSLRFEEKAAADADGDGEITLDELDRARIDVRTYDPSGFAAPTLGAFMRSLARTVGHYRGEGECTVGRAD